MRLVRTLRRTGRDALLTSQLPGILDRAHVARRLSGLARTPRAHVLVAAPGGGNIGDQALTEAFLETTSGPVVVVTRSATDVDVPGWAADRVEVVPLPALVYGTGRAHREALDRFAELLAEASDLSVVGADVMDGRYSLRASVNRASVAHAAARSGVPARVLGFSWNSSPRAAARIALVRATRAGVVAMLRDPASARRARADGVAGVREVADVVFAAGTVADPPAEVLDAVTGPLALVNVSGLIGTGMDQVDEYAQVVAHLRAAGLHVVLLPHVSRPGADDVPACTAVLERFARDDGVTLVARLLTPAQIRGLTARAALTVTGRMHLAIMSLWNGTPAITLATQGKVEGLMELFGTAELCVEPTPGFASTVLGVADAARPPGSPVRVAIAAALPAVLAAAARNIEGLDAAQGLDAADGLNAASRPAGV
jgi:colanic acid/amylovoran biosynthesis protein